MKNIEISFLFYTSRGVCKSNADMPITGESFKGWFSAAGVIRNQSRHSWEDVDASLSALRVFVDGLNGKQKIKEQDLLSFLK